MRSREGLSLRVAVLARSVYPLHRYGGLERHVYDLVRCLLARDVRVVLIAPPDARDRPSDARADAVFRHPNLTTRRVPYTTFPFANRRGTTIVDRSTAYPLFGLRAGRLAAGLAIAGEIDIVHGLGASALGYASTRFDPGTRVPFVFNPQGMEEFGATDSSRAPLKRLGYWPLRMAVRRTAKAADCIIATDRALVEPLKTHLRVGSAVVRLIPNAIELAECDRPDSADRARSLRERIGASADSPVLVSVGRLEANKGFGVLTEALARLDAEKRIPEPFRWVLVGDGPMRESLSRQLASTNLGRRAVMWGRADAADLHGWCEAATLFVHPTLYEGSSLVTLEAMAHRRAVVATRAGGLPDKVIPGGNGWLVAPGDAEALAGSIAEALSDRHRLVVMGDAGRALVEREFSWAVATDRLLDLYRELLTPGGSL
jgi:glycosyltransferase involved in cell wall biosynthesis